MPLYFLCKAFLIASVKGTIQMNLPRKTGTYQTEYLVFSYIPPLTISFLVLSLTSQDWLSSGSLLSLLVGTSLLQEVVYLVSQGADPDEIGLMNIDEQLPVLEYPQPGLDIIQVM